MKKINFILSFLTIIALQAGATSIRQQAAYQSNLKPTLIDPQSSFAQLKSIGQVTVQLHVDLVHKEKNLIEVKALQFQRKQCFGVPPDVKCMSIAPHPPVVITVPYQNYEADSCGSRIYTGAVDERPVDGILQKIVIKDNSKMTCKTFVAVPATEVTVAESWVNRKDGGTVLIESTFAGSKLVEIPLK